jgi:hypothetical protein
MNVKKGKTMKTNIIILCVVLFLAGWSLTGCEMTNYPLILDSSVSISSWIDISAAPPVVVQIPPTLELDTKALRDVTGDNIEKINFYNFTLTADSNSTTTGTLSGYITIDGDTLAVLSELSPSVFATEHSIFDNIAGVEVKNTGLGTLLHAVKNPPDTPLQIKIFMTPQTVVPVKFKLILKVYSQVHAKS